MQAIGEMNITPRVLLGPGPSMCIRACCGHVGAADRPPRSRVSAIMDETKEMLRFVFQTKNPHFPHLGHGQRRHGDVPGQSDRAGRRSARLRQRRVRHAHERHRRALRRQAGHASMRRGATSSTPDDLRKALAKIASPRWSASSTPRPRPARWQPLEETRQARARGRRAVRWSTR